MCRARQLNKLIFHFLWEEEKRVEKSIYVAKIVLASNLEGKIPEKRHI